MNKNKIISIVAVAVGAVCAILSLVFFIMSFGSDNYGEYGAEFWSNTDYLIFLFCSIAVISFGVYQLVKPEAINIYVGLSNTLLFDGILLACYSFGKFFRALAKGNGFSAWYFIFAVVGLVILGASAAVKFLLVKKEN